MDGLGILLSSNYGRNINMKERERVQTKVTVCTQAIRFFQTK